MKLQRLKMGLRSWTAALLALMVALPVFAAPAHAEETVTSIQFESVPSPLTVYIADETYALKVWANVTGGTVSQKDVTSSATWTSSNTSVAKVAGGVVTGLAAGYADITAKYGTVSAITVRVYVKYYYDSVAIQQNGANVPDKQDVILGQTPVYSLNAVRGESGVNATSDTQWTSSNTAVATIDEDGEVTLLSAGTTKITAKLLGRTDAVTLTVVSPYKSLSLSPAGPLEFKVGDDPFSTNAMATLTAGGTEEVTDDAEWTTSNAAVATVEDGAIKPGVQGLATITASYLGVTASVKVMVLPAFQAMKLSDSTLDFTVSDPARQVTANAFANVGAAAEEVTALAEWTSSNPLAATVSAGVITPKTPGSTTVTATYKGQSRSVAVTVYPGVSSIAIAEEELSGFVDGTGDLPAVEGTTLSDDTVNISKLAEWSSDDESIVTVKDGKWTAKKTGEVTLTAKLKTLTASITMTVNDKPLVLQVPSTTLSLVTGKETALPVLSVIYENGTEQTDIGAKATWKSSSPNLLVKDGKMKGLVASKVTLTATYLGISLPIRVTIEEEIVKLTADPAALTLNPGRSKSIKITGTYKSGKTILLGTKADWTVSDEALASMKGSTVKALAEGTVKLTAAYQDKTVAVTLTVKPKLKKLVLSVPSLKLAPGGKDNLVLTAQYDTGKNVNATGTASWTTTNVKVATVNKGAITAVAKGTAVIKAAYEGKTVTIRVTVK